MSKSKKSRCKTKKKQDAMLRRHKTESFMPRHGQKVGDNVSVRFIQLIREAFQSLTTSKFYSKADRQCLRALRDYQDAGDLRDLLQKIATGVYERLDQDHRLTAYIPVNHVDFVVRDQSITMLFQALKTVKTPTGLLYSPFGGIIKVDGEERQIGFHKHVIDRIAERTTATYPSHLAARDVFARLNGCELDDRSLGEIITLEDGGLALRLLEECKDFFLTGQLARIVGMPAQRSSCILGYIPLKEADGYFHGITCLRPGMKGTPEEPLFKQFCRDKCITPTSDGALEYLAVNGGGTMRADAVEYFQQNGHHQVIPTQNIKNTFIRPKASWR